ncbi:MAG: hypothetical protein HYU54_09895 [Actinobacteria bacterium]|nr:hypothetical protein [Actinomycetota bacterium]
MSEYPATPIPQEPASLPEEPAAGPTPVPVLTGAWSAGGPSAGPPKRRLGPAIGAAALVVALVAGLLVFQFTRPREEASAALALAFTEGDSAAYRMHVTMDGDYDAGDLGSEAITMDFSETLSWRVVSVDPDGTATIEVTISDVSGTMNGVPAPAPDAPTTTQMRVAPDGRILSAGGVAFSAPGTTGGTGFPGLGQMTPLLPDHPVAPGDTWEKSFDQEFPFGEGAIRFTSHNRFDRYEDVDGVRTAVIVSDMTVPLDFSLDFGELMAAFGEGFGSDAKGANALKHARMDYSGQGTFVLTSWVDPASKQMLRTSSRGDFDMTMGLSGIPSVPDGTEFAFSGTFTQDLERV